VRLVGGQDPARVLAAIETHIAKVAPDAEVTAEMGMPASRTPLDNQFTPLLADAIAAVTGESPLLVPALGGTLPDYVWTSILEAASLGLPMANIDEANHGPNENLEVDRYLTGIAISMSVLRALAALLPGLRHDSGDGRPGRPRARRRGAIRRCQGGQGGTATGA